VTPAILFHLRAIRHLQDLAQSAFATCESVLAETCFHVPHRSQRLRLRALLDELEIVTLPAAQDGHFRDEVFDWLVKHAEHEPDWTDGCLAVLCGRDTAVEVWTYDRKFRTTWQRPDGTRIPLAVT
jgi:predicted nucleic acid-binding protein